MRTCLALLALLTFGNVAHASELRRGALMQVKPDSIWFEDRTKLAHWQALKQAGDAEAFASYQNGLLQARDAWQFGRPLTFRIRGVEPKAHLVNVELQTAGRLQGSKWLLDKSAIVQ